jgi:hypothetical protein
MVISEKKDAEDIDFKFIIENSDVSITQLN